MRRLSAIALSLGLAAACASQSAPQSIPPAEPTSEDLTVEIMTALREDEYFVEKTKHRKPYQMRAFRLVLDTADSYFMAIGGSEGGGLLAEYFDARPLGPSERDILVVEVGVPDEEGVLTRYRTTERVVNGELDRMLSIDGREQPLDSGSRDIIDRLKEDFLREFRTVQEERERDIEKSMAVMNRA